MSATRCGGVGGQRASPGHRRAACSGHSLADRTARRGSAPGRTATRTAARCRSRVPPCRATGRSTVRVAHDRPGQLLPVTDRQHAPRRGRTATAIHERRPPIGEPTTIDGPVTARTGRRCPGSHVHGRIRRRRQHRTVTTAVGAAARPRSVDASVVSGAPNAGMARASVPTGVGVGRTPGRSESRVAAPADLVAPTSLRRREPPGSPSGVTAQRRGRARLHDRPRGRPRHRRLDRICPGTTSRTSRAASSRRSTARSGPDGVPGTWRSP
jgi:hypothetical protein